MYYFASDVHLGAGDAEHSARIERRFNAWLDAVSRDADEVWLLGDIFDFWFEYGRVVPRGFVRTLGRLADMTDRGIRVVMLTGNHDMWMRGYLESECGVEVYTVPVYADMAGHKLFIAHGDNMQIDGEPMLKFLNALFRSGVVRTLFSWLVHPDIAMRFGRWWSGRSRKAHGGRPDASVLEPLRAYAAELGRTEGVDCCIFGHFHLADDRMAGDVRAVFLSDWTREPVYAEMTQTGELTLKIFEEQ